MFTLFLENYKLKDNPTYICGIPNDTLICSQVVQTMDWMLVTQMISINYHEVKTL